MPRVYLVDDWEGYFLRKEQIGADIPVSGLVAEGKAAHEWSVVGGCEEYTEANCDFELFCEKDVLGI
jgi:hypothetical protein